MPDAGLITESSGSAATNEREGLWRYLALKLSRIGLRIVGTILGSLGVLCVSFSWLGPDIAAHGIICLLGAVAITYALDGKY